MTTMISTILLLCVTMTTALSPLPWVPTPGFCVSCDGKDVVRGDIADGPGHTKETCMDFCKNHKQFTAMACEFRDDLGGFCTIHTLPVAKGSNTDPKSTCFSPPPTCPAAIPATYDGDYGQTGPGAVGVTAVHGWGPRYGNRHNQHLFSPMLGWTGNSKTADHFFHSKANHPDPFVYWQLNRAMMLTSVTVQNRIDCCGERFKNVELRAGMTNEYGLPAYGFYKGPLATGKNYTYILKKPVLCRYIVLYMKGKGTLQVNGIKLNLLPAEEMPPPPKRDVFLYKDFKGKTCVDDVAVQVKGCYKAKKATEPRLHKRGKLLVYFRHDIEWGNIGAFANSLFCACAEAAKQHGVKMFGLHFWGECWALEAKDIVQHKNGDCLLSDGGYDKKCSKMNQKYQYPCLAVQDYYTYKLK